MDDDDALWGTATATPAPAAAATDDDAMWGRAAQALPKSGPDMQPPGGNWYSDILPEVAKSLSTNISGAAAGLSPLDRAEKGVIGGTLEAGKGLLHGLATVPDALQAPLRSVIGHPMADATQWTGRALGKSLEYWFPDTAAGELGKKIAASAEADDPRKIYEKTSQDVTTALQAGRPVGFGPKGKVPVEPYLIPAMPTQQIKETAANLLETASQHGVQVKPQAFLDQINALRDELRGERFFDMKGGGKAAFGKLKEVERALTGKRPLDEAASKRVAAQLKQAGLSDAEIKAAMAPKGAEMINDQGLTDIGRIHSVLKDLRDMQRVAKNDRKKEALRLVESGLEDWLYKLPDNPGALAGGHGNVQRAVEDLQRGTAMWSIYRKNELVEDVVRNAFAGVRSTGAKSNIENKLLQGIKSIYTSKARRRGFNQDELKMMEEIIDLEGKDKMGHMLTLLGKLAPSGVISGVAGLEIAHLLGAHGISKFIPAAVGVASKLKAEARKMHQIDELSTFVRNPVTKGVMRTTLDPIDWKQRRLFDPRVMGPFLSQFEREEDKHPIGITDAQGNRY